jgi:hypothetical protein
MSTYLDQQLGEVYFQRISRRMIEKWNKEPYARCLILYLPEMAVIEKHERHFVVPESGSTIIDMLN